MNYQVISNLSEGRDYIETLKNVDIVAVDTETTSLDTFSCIPILLQICTGEKTFIFDWRKIGNEKMTRVVKTLIDKMCIFHNARYDLEVIYNNTGILLVDVYDTMLAEILINNGLGSKYPSLSELHEKYFSETLEKGTRSDFADNPDIILEERHFIYSVLDVARMHEIRDRQLHKLAEQKQLDILHLEMETLPVVTSMHLNGVKLNADVWRELEVKTVEGMAVFSRNLFNSIFDKVKEKNYPNAYEAVMSLGMECKTKKLKAMLEGITEIDFIVEYIRNNINLDSNKQLKYILTNLYGLDIESTNAKIIDKLALDFPIIGDILKYRKFSKSSSSFGENYLERIHPITGRIHADFHQLGASSGRFSCSNPNLQNVKRESEYRHCFIAREGYKLISADYSQQEYRVMASIMNVKKMKEAFAANIDLHSMTASGLYEVPIEQVTKDQRSRGKSLNFAVGYGSSEYGLYKNFNIPLEEGKEMLNKFYGEIYPEIRTFKDIAGQLIWERGYSVTRLGRRRHFNKLTLFTQPGEFRRFKEKVIREGINHIVQGTSADITKIALCKIFYESPFGEELKILIQVHDEIVCEVREDLVPEAMEFIKNCMESAEQPFLKDIVAKVDIHAEDHWTKE